MAQHSQAPMFGNWESEENVSYTEYFENKRKPKGGGRKNPNGPRDNTPPVQAPPQQGAELKGQMDTEAITSKHELRTSHQDVKIRRLTDSPLHIDTVGQTSHGGTSPGETPKRVTRKSAGSDHSIDHSPLHPHYQARVGRKVSGVSSPSLEKKGSSEGSHGLSPSTPGRSRLRSVTRGDNTADHSPVVPKFGDWDESDPTSAEHYSHIFNKVREEKQIGEGKVPGIATETSNSTGQKQYGNDNSKSCCCFPWGRR
ncbi:hypothetical protein CsSME_00034068 [Camellia sinensis var. sinensis]